MSLADTMEVIEVGNSVYAPYGLSLSVDAGTVAGAEVEIGFGHRGLERRLERTGWRDTAFAAGQINCLSPFHCSLGACLAVEELLAVEVPRRAVLLRIVGGEAWRICDHAMCVARCMDAAGATQLAQALVSARRAVVGAIDAALGGDRNASRLCVCGFARDVEASELLRLERSSKDARQALESAMRFVEKDMLVRGRACGLGTVSHESALTWGITGPILRAAGGDSDIRREAPYLAYGELDWTVVTGFAGDALDRITVRLLEAVESSRMVCQAISLMEPGPVAAGDRALMPPSQHEVYGSIDGSIRHFKIMVDGVRAPSQEIYRAVESDGGELGFALASTGGTAPHRMRVRSPSLAACQLVPRMVEGMDLEDVPLALASLGIAAGEMDR